MALRDRLASPRRRGRAGSSGQCVEPGATASDLDRRQHDRVAGSRARHLALLRQRTEYQKRPRTTGATAVLARHQPLDTGAVYGGRIAAPSRPRQACQSNREARGGERPRQARRTTPRRYRHPDPHGQSRRRFRCTPRAGWSHVVHERRAADRAARSGQPLEHGPSLAGSRTPARVQERPQDGTRSRCGRFRAALVFGERCVYDADPEHRDVAFHARPRALSQRS